MFKPEDLYQVQWVGDVQLSPDGQRYAYVQRQSRADGGGYESTIWVGELPDGEPRPLVPGGCQAHSPRWAPDNRTLAYISNRSGTNQLWCAASTGENERQLTDVPGGITAPAWAPDGSQLACVSRVPAEDGEAEEEIAGPLPQRRLVRRLAYKWDGRGWWDGKYTQVFTVSFPAGETRQLTTGDFDHRSPVFSPDGQRIALVANRSADADYSNFVDLWTMPAQGGPLTQLTRSQGPVVTPVWYPDGGAIAYLGHDQRYERATCTTLYRVDTAGRQEIEDLLEGYPYPATGMVVSDMVGTASSSSPVITREGDLLFISTIAGSQQVQRLAPAGGPPQALTEPGRVVYDMAYSPANDRLLLLITEPTNIGDVFLSDALGTPPQPLTAVNRDWLPQRAVSQPQRVAFTGVGGDEVEGWLYHPPGFDPTKQYPLVLFIHGGSNPCHGYAFTLDFQVLASDGFIVFAPNQRGSQGYGQDRAASVKHQWCGPDYEDLMLGMDFVAALPYVDEQRLGVTGGSYGGLLTNWIVTHTDRFRAAVTQRSTSNRFSNWGTCDNGWQISRWVYPANPWEDCQFYMDWSPMMHVEQVNTPLLIVHSEYDYRCNLEQAEQFYRALKYLRKPVELVIFLGECHELSRSGRPFNRTERMRQIRRWFRKYLKPEAKPS